MCEVVFAFDFDFDFGIGFGIDFGVGFGSDFGSDFGIDFVIDFVIDFGIEFGIDFGIGFAICKKQVLNIHLFCFASTLLPSWIAVKAFKACKQVSSWQLYYVPKVVRMQSFPGFLRDAL